LVAIGGRANLYEYIASLLADDSDYRKLAYWAPSLEVRMAVLFAANDINLARVHKSIPDGTIRLATETDAFTSGVMRSSAAYRANWKGARYVSREVPPWIEDSRRDFDVHAQLEGFETPHVVPFKFGTAKTTLVSDRIHVLIGKNGTGKTQLLNQIIGSIAVRAEDSDQAVFLDRPNADYKVDAAPVAEIPNAVLVFSFDAGDPFPEQTRLDTPLDYSYVNLAATATEDESDTPKYSLGEALRNLIRDDVQLQGKTRFQIFLDVIGPVLEVSLLHIPVNAKSRGATKLSNVFIDSSERGWLSLAKVPRGEQLTLTSPTQVAAARKVKVFCEDDFAIHFAKRLIKSQDVLKAVEFHSSMDPQGGKPGTGWTALRSVCVQFPLLLQGALALFDADVGPSELAKIKDASLYLVLPDAASLAIERRIVAHIIALGNDDPFFTKFGQERDVFLSEFKAADIKSLTLADVIDKDKTPIARCKAWADSDKVKFKKYVTHYCDHSGLAAAFRAEFIQRINKINQQVGLPGIH